MLDLEPSARPHGAQRSFIATLLAIEGCVVYFTLLVIYGLYGLTWSIWFGAALGLAYFACCGLLARAAGYWIGGALQLGLVVLAIEVPMLWILVIVFWPGYVYCALTGHRLDREKDQIDARVRAAEDASSRPGTGEAEVKGKKPQAGGAG